MGLAFLGHVKDHGHQDNDDDDPEARNVSGDCRYCRGKEQNQNKRIAKTFDSGRSRLKPTRMGSVEKEDSRVAAGSAIPGIAGNLFDVHQRQFVPGV